MTERDEKKYQTDKSDKSLDTSKVVYKEVMQYYINAQLAKKDKSKLLCYHTGFDPIEIDYAMDVIPILPENFSAACGANQISPTLMEIAEGKGCPDDLCSYFKNHYGYMKGGMHLPELAPTFAKIGMPEPDLVCSMKNVCRLHPIWMRVIQEHYGVPGFTMDSPLIHPRMDKKPIMEGSEYGGMYRHELDDHYIEFGVEQLRNYIAFLEDHTGRKLDMGRLKETVALSDRLSAIFEEIMELRKAVPSPMGGEDMNSIMFFLVTMSGTESAVKVFQTAAQEVRKRVEEGRGVLSNEKHRIIFEGIPPWFNMGLFNYLHEFDAITVDEFYPKLWYGRMDPDYPLESLAKKYMGVFGNALSYQVVRENLEPRVRDYKADGVVLWNLTTCRVASAILAPRIGEVYKEDLGVPILVVNADQIDPRVYNEVEVKDKIETFLEMLGENG